MLHTMALSTFPTVNKCTSIGREQHTVVADMDGTLLIGRSSFPYFALVAFEAGGVLRLLFYVLASPIAALLYYFISESAGIQVLIFFFFFNYIIRRLEDIIYWVLISNQILHFHFWKVLIFSFLLNYIITLFFHEYLLKKKIRRSNILSFFSWNQFMHFKLLKNLIKNN